LNRGERKHPLIVVHPGCSMPARTYSALRYAEVVELLVRNLGAQVVITGTEPELVVAETIYARLSGNARRAVQIRAGDWPLSHLAALIDAADLVITNNTGPMHLAAATGTPSVVLFALTNPPDEWRPWNALHRLLYEEVPCRHCYSRICPYEDHPCLNGVAPSAVVASAHELLAGMAAA
jgi:ADP-heptose:LPS heptosyltransferase